MKCRIAVLATALIAFAGDGRAQAATPTPPPITFFGEIRARSEWDRPGDVRADVFTYLRSRFGARIDPTPGARVVLQLQDSRVLGSEGNTSAAAPDVFDLHQGYIELSSALAATMVTLRAGRQEIALGNERLVGAVNWSNTGRSFDGARVVLGPAKAGPVEPWTATLFVATMEERGRRFGATGATQPTDEAPDHTVAGLFTRRALAVGTLEATALYDGGARYRAYTGSNRTTVDGRWRVPHALGLSMELEGAYQFGRQRVVTAGPATARRQTVSAWLAGARLGTAEAAGRRIGTTLGVDLLSGDATPADGRYGAFSTMFATNHPFYGLMDLFLDPSARTKDRGLTDILATGSFALGPRTTLRSELHHFAAHAGPVKSLGWEGDVVLPVRVNSAAAVDIGYTAFRAGRAAAGAGLGESGSYRQWAYLQLRVGF